MGVKIKFPGSVSKDGNDNDEDDDYNSLWTSTLSTQIVNVLESSLLEACATEAAYTFKFTLEILFLNPAKK